MSSHLVLTRADEEDISALYNWIRENPEILKKINDTPIVDTPLHAAASTGKTHLVVEIMTLMPSFCRKLNCDGLSPLHLALQNGHLETARHMIKLEGRLIRVPGRRKMTPMHYLVSICQDNERNKLELLIDFLQACPEAVKDVTVECKTPMHVAIDSKHFDAFGVLYGWLWRTGQLDLLEEMEDIDGNTALRQAAEPEAVKRLKKREVFRKIVNSRRQIVGISEKKKDLDRCEFFLSPETLLQKIIRYSAYMHKGLSMDMRNVVLIVAVLVATAVYQATLTPPNGVTQASAGHDLTTDTVPIDPNLENPIDVHHKRFVLFVSMNTLAFNLALGVMLFVLPFGLYSGFLHLALYFMSVSFLVLLDVLSEDHRTTASVLMFSSLGLFGITYCARFFIAFLKAISWMPWWIGPPYRIMHNFISRMKMQMGFHKIHLQIETVGWSGHYHGSYYRD